MLTENDWKGILINSPIHFELGDVNTLAEYLSDVSNSIKLPVSGSVCLCKVNRTIVRHENKDWCNICGELVKAN